MTFTPKLKQIVLCLLFVTLLSLFSIRKASAQTRITEDKVREAVITFLENELFSLAENNYTFEFHQIAITDRMAYSQVVGTWDGEWGIDSELFHVYLLFNGNQISHVFREPSPAFFQFAHLLPTDWLPQERLQSWLAIKNEESQHLLESGTNYVLPFNGGQSYLISRGGTSHNNSYDFVMASGTIVRVVRGGEISRVIQDPTNCPGGNCSGTYIRVLHVDGTYGWYLHLQYQSPTVSEGQFINQGKCIALSGNTGNSTGPHLHYNTSTDLFNNNRVLVHWQEAPANNPNLNGTNFQSPVSQSRTGTCANVVPLKPEHLLPSDGDWTRFTKLQCTAGDDDGIPSSPTYRFQVDNNSNFSSPEFDSGWGHPNCLITATLAIDANYYWRVNQSDGEFESGWTDPWLFKLDRAIPYANCVPTGTSGSNGWFTSNVTVSCSFHDNTGTNNSGIATSSPQPPTFPLTGEATHLVSFSATDFADNTRTGSRLVNIDYTSPAISNMAINNGANTTYSANVLLSNSAFDGLSGLWETCASLDQVNWSCTEYGTAMPFSLPNNNQATHTVYFRVKDRAGNLSAIVSDSIFLDLYPALPSSNNYQMCGGTVAAAAGSASSSSYQQHQGVMGVPGSGYSESTSYQLFVGVPRNCHAAANSQNNYLPLVIAAP